MIDIPLNVALNLAKGTVKVGWRAKKMRDEARATGDLVCRSLRLAVDDLVADRAVSEALAKAIASELAHTPLSPIDQPTGVRRLIPKGLRRKIPDAAVLSGAPFSERLERWVARGVEGPQVQMVLAAYGPLPTLDPTRVAERFSVDFHGLLVEDLTPFNEVLIKELQSSETARAWMEEKRRRFQDGVAGAATAGAGAYGVTQLANLHDPLLITAAVVATAGVSGLAWLGSLSRPEVSPLQRAARRIALGWVADLFRWLEVTPQPGTISEMRLAVSGMDRLKADRGAEIARSALLQDLTARVIRVADEADDEQLVVAIRGVEDAVIRAGRKGPDTLAAALMEMLDAIAADESIPEAELPSTGTRGSLVAGGTAGRQESVTLTAARR